jgi:tRNA-splicing ligase RtcB (3'-phosphate/5'-hydroxy nucleic acid ligase)
VKTPTIFTPSGVDPDEGAREQINACLEDERAVAGALMADHHLGYSMPIGGVIAYDGAISPSGVGFDIACGNKAVLTPLLAVDLDVRPVMEEIQRTVAFGLGRTDGSNGDHDLFDNHSDTLEALDDLVGPGKQLSQKARQQLGTVGSGNHYVDLLADEKDRVWVANHFGSRGLGHTIATGFLNLADGEEFKARGAEKDEPTVIPTDSELGQFYIAAMELAGDYAYAGRDYVIGQVLSILGTDAVESVHNHHNFAWFEDGFWVIRKGATPLTQDLAFIGGSMGDGAVIVRGTGEDIGALDSAPHGAGRVMSRTKAAGKWKKQPVERTAPDGSTYTKQIRVRDESTAAVNWRQVKDDLNSRGIVVLGSGADEAPEVYKPLDDVLAAHSNIQVVHRLRPLGVVMAGDDTFDPYKD